MNSYVVMETTVSVSLEATEIWNECIQLSARSIIVQKLWGIYHPALWEKQDKQDFSAVAESLHTENAFDRIEWPSLF